MTGFLQLILALYLLYTGIAAFRSPAAEKSRSRRRERLAAGSPPKTPLAVFCLPLVLATLAVYFQTTDYGFVYFDDPSYVYENEMVKAGLTLPGVLWAFTTFATGNWHPLTWLSFMLGCQLFGLDAGAQHLMNVALHLANTLLLFLAFARMTRQPWPSALVAAIFAVHPLHVESVAWISERKDVLSTFFAMLALLLYARYAEAPGWRTYIPVVAAFALGLLAKPMLVTFPLVLLLMDVWPLRRIALPWPAGGEGASSWPVLKPLLREKAPLLLLAAASCLLTLLAHRDSADFVSLAALPFSDRLANASIAGVSYLGKAFWPVDLAMLYPYHLPSRWEGLGALAVLAAITLASVRLARRRPYFLVGWLWYLGMLVPVSGIVQVGSQSMADRYMYMPLTGLSFAVVWAAADMIEDAAGAGGRRRFLKVAAALLAGAALFLLAAGAYRQAGYWKDSQALYTHTLAVTKNNGVIHYNLGMALGNEGQYEAAAEQYEEALAILPDYASAHENLGMAYGRLGRFDDAIVQSTLALKQNPANSPVQNNFCAALNGLGRHDEAIVHCREAVRLDPDNLAARYNLGKTLAAEGKNTEAAAEFSRILAANPDFSAASAALRQLGRPAGKKPAKEP